MGTQAQENIVLRRTRRFLYLSMLRRIFTNGIPNRVGTGIHGNDGVKYSVGRRQEMSGVGVLKDKEKFRDWVRNHAYSITFLLVLFGVGYVMSIAQAYGWIGH